MLDSIIGIEIGNMFGKSLRGEYVIDLETGQWVGRHSKGIYETETREFYRGIQR